MIHLASQMEIDNAKLQNIFARAGLINLNVKILCYGQYAQIGEAYLAIDDNGDYMITTQDELLLAK